MADPFDYSVPTPRNWVCTSTSESRQMMMPNRKIGIGPQGVVGVLDEWFQSAS
jgi:hypothetical protein